MVYRFQDFEADPARGCLRRGGEEVALRRKAFQVLIALLEHQDRLVTKEELFAWIWPDTAVTDDVLAGVITELRKVLQDNPKSPVFIKTMPRAGYRFIGTAECIEPAAAVRAIEPVLPETPPRTAANAPSRLWFTLGAAVLALGGWLVLQQTLGRVEPPGNDLQEVGWWRFDEASGNQAKDSSGRGNAGAIFGSVARVPGKLGTALSLDGRTVYVKGTDALNALPGKDAARSFTVWMRTASTNGDQTQLFMYGGALPVAEKQGQKVIEKIGAAVRMDGKLLAGWDIPGRGLDGRSRVDDGQWHHVAATFRPSGGATETHLYLDGREDASGKLFPLATEANPYWWIGGAETGTRFRGEIDDVRVFNGALNGPQVSALHRCTAAIEDLRIVAVPYYFMPVFEGAEMQSGAVRNFARDHGGIQFAKLPGGDCKLDSLRGADVGQDLRISADLLVPTDEAGHTTEGGPYFRSRRAGPGDGLIGGTSAGYWVVLYSSGAINVQRLNPNGVIAFATISNFNASVFHHLEVAAVGERLQVRVDGDLIRFDHEGKQSMTVSIPPLWQGPPGIGNNRGTAGVAFSARQNRGAIGGQTVKAIRVERATALFQP